MCRMPMALVPAAVAILALSACSSSSAKSNPGTSVATSTPSTTLVAPTSSPSASGGPNARILSLSGPTPPLLCNAPTQVELHWVTESAKSVTLTIDGGPVFASYANGKRDELVPLACTGAPQTYLLTAHAANGATVTKSLTITERESIAS